MKTATTTFNRNLGRRQSLRRTRIILALAWSFWRDARAVARAQRMQAPGQAQPEIDAIYRRGGERFRRTALSLGGLIIKVGQFLSARTDLLPLAFTRELQQLQDQVPAASFDSIHREMEAAWGRPPAEVLVRIDPVPVAAASLGQVHRAVLVDGGETVAIKVRRPGIEALAAVDLRALGWVVAALQRWTRVGRRLDLRSVFAEFRQLVGRELDYTQEAENLRRFREDFADIPAIRVPREYPQYVCKTVLVMEFVSGVKLTDADGLAALGCDRKELAVQLVQSYLRQMLMTGLIQLDPHPGNFLVDESHRLIFLDFGMMAQLSDAERRGMIGLVEAAVARHPGGVVRAMDDLGFLRPHANRPLLNRAIASLIDRIAGIELTQGPAMDRMVADLQDFLYEEPLQFPAAYMFLGRALGMLFSRVNDLDPKLNWLDLLRNEALPMIRAARPKVWDPPFMRRLGDVVGEIFGEAAHSVFDLVSQEAARTVRASWQLPEAATRLIRQLEDESLATRPELTGVYRRLDAIALEMRFLRWTGLGGFFLLLLFYLRQYGPHQLVPWLWAVLALIAANGFWLFTRLRRKRKGTR